MHWLSLPPLELTATRAPRRIISRQSGGTEMPEPYCRRASAWELPPPGRRGRARIWHTLMVVIAPPFSMS